jgi:hypothetical protein
LKPRRPELGDSDAWRAGYREGFDEGLMAGAILATLLLSFGYAAVTWLF